MKILYLINHAGKGGSEKYVEVLAKNLNKSNVEVFLIYNEEGLLVNKMKDLNIKTYRINMKNPFDLVSAYKIYRFCKNNDIDIIHAQFPRENYLALISKLYGCKAKVIYTSHINIKNNFIWKISNLILTQNNSGIIAVCNSVKTLLISNNYPKNKIHVIFNGVLFNKGYISHSMDNEEFVFVTLARLSAEKGIIFLLESISVLSKITSKSFKLIIAGDGPMEDEAKSYVKHHNLADFVEFVGFTSNPKEILHKGNVFINSSQSEALSFAILEAMAEGLPVIATNVGGNSDIINKDTNCGILVTYNNPLEMAEAMKKILDDRELYIKLSKNSYDAIKSTFNIEETINKTYSLYKDVLNS